MKYSYFVRNLLCQSADYLLSEKYLLFSYGEMGFVAFYSSLHYH